MLLVVTLNFIIAWGLPAAAKASFAGCPSTWSFKVELRPEQKLSNIPGRDPESFFAEGYFYESSGGLDAAIKQFGRNISYKFYAEWSNDGKNGLISLRARPITVVILQTHLKSSLDSLFTLINFFDTSKMENGE
jgi:hypothetical protein